MSFCVAVDCYNQSNKNKDISFHTLPKDDKMRKVRVIAIGRSGRICPEQFTQSSYEDSNRLKFELCPAQYTERKATRKRLTPGAVPTIFSHNNRPPTKERNSSIERARREEHNKDTNYAINILQWHLPFTNSHYRTTSSKNTSYGQDIHTMYNKIYFFIYTQNKS